MGMSSMGRRLLRFQDGDEQDAFTRWRHLYCYLARPGVRAAIKKKYRQRERHKAKQDIREKRFE